MKTLYELAKVTANQKVVHSLISDKDQSPLRKLYQLVCRDTEQEEESAMIEIYGSRNLAAFSRLKARLRELLIRAVLLQNINEESNDSRMNETFNQFRYTIASKILKDLKAESLSTELAERALVKAIKYQSSENVILLTRLLVRNYGGREPNKYKLNKYLDIQSKYLKIYEWEIKAENFYFDLQRIQLQSLASASELTIQTTKKYVQILNEVSGVNTFHFNQNKYRIQAALFEYQKDYSSLLKLSDTAVKEFDVPEIRSEAIIVNFIIRKLYALIQAGRNEEAATIGEKEFSKLTEGSRSWFLIGHYTLKANIYSENYKKSIELISKIVGNNKFPKLVENIKEIFLTTLGYIHLVVESGLLDKTKTVIHDFPEFKLYKYLNATPIFTKDKRGLNVAILFLHIAFLLLRKDYNSIIDRMDSLNQYAYRYLRKDDSFRSNCMIKMVVQMTKADFNPIRTERYTQDLFRQLRQVHLAGSGENIETEVIPYEVLWDLMKKSL